MRPCLRLKLILSCLIFSLGGCNATMTKSINSISDLATSVASLGEDTNDEDIDLTNHTNDSLCYALENWKQNRKAVRKELEKRGYRTRGKQCVGGGSSTVIVKKLQEHKRTNKSIRPAIPSKNLKPATASNPLKPAAKIIATPSSDSPQSIERKIIATYGKPDEVERLGGSVVFKYCKSKLVEKNSYTYVWADSTGVRQVFKGKWNSEFLCAGAHRQVNWPATVSANALTLIQPAQRQQAPKKGFMDALAEGMSESIRSNQQHYNGLINKGEVRCNKLYDRGFPKQVYTFQGSFCPVGYIQAF